MYCVTSILMDLFFSFVKMLFLFTYRDAKECALLMQNQYISVHETHKLASLLTVLSFNLVSNNVP